MDNTRAHVELDKLVARARIKDSAPRKHHLVPRSYLQRWAVDNKVRVTDLDTDKSYCSDPKQIARITDYYSLKSDDIDPAELPANLFEVLLGNVENEGKKAIDQLLVNDPADIDPELMAHFTWFLALQLTRGQRYRRQQQDTAQSMAKMQLRELPDAGIRSYLEKVGRNPTSDAIAETRAFIDDLNAGRLRVRQQNAAITANSGAIAHDLGGHLLSRDWTVWRTPPILFTSDEPVLLIGGPGRERKQHHGVQTSAVVAFPLCPDAVLVMSKTPIDADANLDHVETAELNREIMASASRWVFERGDRNAATHMQVPPLPADSVLSEELPLVGRPGKRLFHTYQPTRWASIGELAPPWPVRRWYGL